VTNLDVKVNKATVVSTSLPTTAIDWTTLPELSFGLSESTDLDVGGTLDQIGRASCRARV
jgi:hypothetical protein